MIYIIQFIYFIPIHKLQTYNFIGEKKYISSWWRDNSFWILINKEI